MDTARIQVKYARKNAGMTQADVAEALGVTKQTVLNWEAGKTEPSVAQAKQLSRLYRIPFDMLIFLPEESN